MHNRIAQFVALLLLLLVPAACDSSGAGNYMSIGTGGTGGVYYPFGGILASRLNAHLPDYQFTAEVTAASVENVRRLEQGQIDLGMSIAVTVREGYNGEGEFEEPFSTMRIVAPMWPNPLNLMVPANSGIRSVADLTGRRVSVGAPGSGTVTVARMVLEAYGMSFDDIDEQYLSFSESSAAIRDGAVDAAFLEVAFPASAVMEATTTGSARLLDVAGPEIDAMIAQRPYFFPYVIPGGSYRGIDQDVQTIAELNWIVAREDLPDDVATAVLDILSDERQQLIEANSAVEQIDLENLRRAPIPLHPATEAWLER